MAHCSQPLSPPQVQHKFRCISAPRHRPSFMKSLGRLPGPGFVWMEGYWAPAGRHYRWVRGHWERPPFEGAYWTHPHYDHYREGWQLHEGHWDREDHDSHH